MKEISKEIFVGDVNDYETQVAGKEGWVIVHACKDPYHRKLLGYKTKALPTDHPEYLFAVRENRLFMNLVDAPSRKLFNRSLIVKALDFIDQGILVRKKILIHCNQGMSRSPSIGMLYLATRLGDIPNNTFDATELAFKELYSNYNPGTGIRGHLIENWEFYCGRESA